MLGYDFNDWKLVNESNQVVQAVNEINTTNWDEIWKSNCWRTVDSRKIFADLLLSNGIAQVCRLHEHIKKMETQMIKLLRNLMSELDDRNTDHDDPIYQDTNAKLEKINFSRAKERLAYDKDFLNLKNEKITSEIIRRMQDSSINQAKLSDVTDPRNDETMGKDHGNKLAEVFYLKFKK